MKKMERTLQDLIREAQLLNIRVELQEDCAMEHILFAKNGKEVLFSPNGTPLDQLSVQTAEIAANKQYCKKLFQQLDIPHPKSLTFEDLVKEQTTLQSFFKKGQLYVCKPLDGTEGEGICMNIRNWEGLEEAWNRLKSQYHTFLLEEQKAGGDLRIQVLDGQMVAACIREPASVVGDGSSTLSKLARKKNEQIQALNPANKLELDAASFKLIEQQGLSLESIPAKGQQVQLKYVANMNQGARAIDITDEVHPAYQIWVDRLAQVLQTGLFALDVLTLDHRLMPDADRAWALEINVQPYWYHHTFSERRTHNMARLILESVFGR